MTTQQIARPRQQTRGLLEAHYRTIGISAVVAAVEGRDRPAKPKKLSAEELKLVERFQARESD